MLGTEQQGLVLYRCVARQTQVYTTNLKGEHKALTDEVADYALLGLAPDGASLFVKKHSMSQADEVYRLSLKGKNKPAEQLTFENQYFYDKLTFGKVEERWVNTVDGKKMLCWVVYPPHFDPNKNIPPCSSARVVRKRP